jgi:hypothetical protein
MTGQPDAAAARRTAWLAFGPLATVVGLRWVLAWLDDRAARLPAWPLQPFAGAQGPLDAAAASAWVLAALLALCAALWWLRRRHGAPLRNRVLAVLWLLLGAAACAAQLYHYLNLSGLRPEAAPLAARVAGTHFKPPSLRSAGGQLLVLQLAGAPGAAPLQVRIDDPRAQRIAPGQHLLLHWARGRFAGRYVTGWQMADDVPAAAAPATR